MPFVLLPRPQKGNFKSLEILMLTSHNLAIFWKWMDSLFQGVFLKRFLITFILFHILCLAQGPLAFLIKHWSWSHHLSLSLLFGSQLLDLDKTFFVPCAFLGFACHMPRLSLELSTSHSTPSSPSWGSTSLELEDPISFEPGSPPFSELLCSFILLFITRPS